jgi:hypothetical protein
VHPWTQDGCEKLGARGTQFCILHGGGKRCQEPRCTKAANGSYAFCIAHGGGKRFTYPNCKVPNCNVSAVAPAERQVGDTHTHPHL